MGAGFLICRACCDNRCTLHPPRGGTMKPRKERDSVGDHTGAYWYGGHRITRCEIHKKKWVPDLCTCSNHSWCVGFEKLQSACAFIAKSARPEIARVRHLKLVVNR